MNTIDDRVIVQSDFILNSRSDCQRSIVSMAVLFGINRVVIYVERVATVAKNAIVYTFFCLDNLDIITL